MKAAKFLSVCSVALALAMVAPVLAQEEPRSSLDVQQLESLDAGLGRVPFVVNQVAVECNRRCDLITLEQACGTDTTPIAVDCESVRDQSGTRVVPCGGGQGLCSRAGILASDPLSLYCNDGPGWDANVYCAQ